MNKLKNLLFLLGIIFGIVGLMGMTYIYFNGIGDTSIFYMICLCLSIIFSWSYIILQYWLNGYFKRKKDKKNG